MTGNPCRADSRGCLLRQKLRAFVVPGHVVDRDRVLSSPIAVAGNADTTDGTRIYEFAPPWRLRPPASRFRVPVDIRLVNQFGDLSPTDGNPPRRETPVHSRLPLGAATQDPCRSPSTRSPSNSAIRLPGRTREHARMNPCPR